MRKIKNFFIMMYETVKEARRLEAELMVKRYRHTIDNGR
jgi:hypothetical protein